MSGPEHERRTIVSIVVDDRGWMICGTVDGVAIETPKPLTARTAAAYLRLWLPQLWNEPQRPIADETVAGGES